MSRLKNLIFALAVVLVPSISIGDVLYLKDGSALKGKVVTLVGDTLLFDTSFGGRVKVDRADIARIDFLDEMPPGGVVPSLMPTTAAEVGTLFVTFDDFELTSRISVHRDRDIEGHERSNSIEQMLLINDRKAFSYIDSTTDKVVKKGVETILRNNMKPAIIKVGLPSGTHRCHLKFANTRVGEYGDQFKDRVDQDLAVGTIVILPGEATVVHVGIKRKKLGFAGKALYVIR